MSNKDNIEDLLEERKIPTSIFFVLFSICVVLAIVIGIFLLNNSHISFRFKNETNRITFILFILSIISGVLGSLVASLIYKYMEVKFYDIHNNNILKRLKSIGNDGLLISIFNEILYYNKRHCEEYVINVRLKKSSFSNDLLECITTYSYKKKLDNRNLSFQFIRITNDKDVTEIDLINNDTFLMDNYFNNEYYYCFDERSYPEVANIVDKFYKLNSLEIKTKNGKIEKQHLTKTTEGSNIIYQSTLKKDIDIENELIELHYQVIYPVEFGYISCFTIELPTKNVRFEFDFSEVQDCISVYPFDFLSSHKGPSKLHQSGETVIKYAKDGWILPKSSFVVAWFKK
ncbi:MAG: hypothetical protein K1X55_17095 [Chitinophagales bacterium]|nr:hypothetical protein [Chitinophagales bacterium]